MARGSLGTMAVRGTSFVLAFFATILLARYLGIVEFGIYSEAIAWSSVVAVLGTFGMDRFLVREISGSAATGSWPALHGLLRTAPRYAFAFGVVAALIAALAFLLVKGVGESNEVLTFAIAIAMSPLMSLAILRQGMLQGLGKVVSSCLPEDIARPLIFIVALLVAFGLGDLSENSAVAMAFQAMALAFSFVLGILLLRRHVPKGVFASKPELIAPRKIVEAFPLGVFAAVNIMLLQVGTILLGLVSTSDQVALFATSLKLAIGVGLAGYAVDNAYQPMVASMLATNNRTGVKRLAPSVGATALLLTLPLAFGLFVFAGPFLSLFGQEFESGETVLRLLCVSYAVSPLFGQNGALLSMSNNVKPLVRGSAAALVLNVALTLILAPDYGAEGAAIAWLVSLIFLNLILGFQVWRTMGIVSSPLVLLRRKRAG